MGFQCVSVMPTNLCGPNDNYDLNNSHVLPALIRKAHEAKLRGDATYAVWGSGQDVTIRELAETVMEVVGFKGAIVFDASKPDGTPRKLLNVDRLRALGWQAHTSLRDGVARAYADFLRHSSLSLPGIRA